MARAFVAGGCAVKRRCPARQRAVRRDRVLFVTSEACLLSPSAMGPAPVVLTSLHTLQDLRLDRDGLEAQGMLNIYYKDVYLFRS